MKTTDERFKESILGGKEKEELTTEVHRSITEKEKMILNKELSEKVIGLAIEVHKNLGNGFLEKVYENALMLEFRRNHILAQNQYPIAIYYKGEVIGEYFADILVEDQIILELKVAKAIEPIHEAQLLHYLRSTNLKIGYILNFGCFERLQFKRLVN